MASPKDCTCQPSPKPLAGANGTVFCSGPLLETVQMSGMFADGKSFVDMKLRCKAEKTLKDFHTFSNCKKNDGSLKFLQMFVENHFDPQGADLEAFAPTDYKCDPAFLSQVCDADLKKFGTYLNETWKTLCVRVRDDVKKNPDSYSIVHLPNPTIIPGGRFTEYYYWDSYWIVRGLLYSDMDKTARGMIENFLYLVRTYGFVPGCGRIYCSGRSHPPMLIQMVKAYVEFTNDEKFAVDALPMLEKEFDTFLENHSVEVKGHTMYVYRDSTTGPRPEAMCEDRANTDSMCNEDDKEGFYSDVKAACESGQAFSSRWYISEAGTNEGSVSDTHTTCIVPVDLNAILFRNCKILAEFNATAGNAEKANEYQIKACEMLKAINDVLWNDCAGIWLDYDLKNNKARNYFAASNLSPLWLRAYGICDTDKIAQAVMKYIKFNKLDSYPGGVPATLYNSGQQWDFPNVWPPQMYMIIEGLEALGTSESKELSKKWAQRWVRHNYEAYQQKGAMFEKYNCEEFGGVGSGGGYEVQTGFGWTNGIIIEFMARYGQSLSLTDESDDKCKCKKPDQTACTQTRGSQDDSNGLPAGIAGCTPSAPGGALSCFPSDGQAANGGYSGCNSPTRECE
ncbi:trehalase [Scaptodrosophila lebanonensis]|uniref:Trehalase n=1 Tax=Drosophila lebanonensis TaxID=7225 RepID=A0A6J2TMH9_DROLE|nr:trehalase [Scaptodrosophila lebanonensis]